MRWHDEGTPMGFSDGSPLGVDTHLRELSAVVIPNVIPLIGVGVLGWNISALVVLYWLELAVIFGFAVLRALFAGRRSEFESDGLIIGALSNRRASLSVPRTDVAVHLSSIPVAVIAVPLLAALWLAVGAFTVGVVGADRLGDATFGIITLALFGILFAEAAQTAGGYLYRGAYKDHSAQTAIRGPFIRGVFLLVGGLLTVMIAATGSDSIGGDTPLSEVDAALVGTPVLIGIVLVKLSFDLAGVYRDTLTAFDESTAISFGWAYEPPAEKSIDTTLTGEPRSIRPDRRGRLLGGIVNLIRYAELMKLGGVIWLVSILFAIASVWRIAAVLTIAGVVIPLLLATVDYWLRYGAVEYRTDGDAIVAFDHLFDQPLWRIEPWDETALRIKRDRLDTYLDTYTIVLTRLDETAIRIPRVSTPQPLLSVFDRRADGADLLNEQ